MARLMTTKAKSRIASTRRIFKSETMTLNFNMAVRKLLNNDWKQVVTSNSSK